MILVADYETGGIPAGKLDPEGGSLRKGEPGPVTLGVALMEGETVVEGREWIFAPDARRRYDAEAERVHGYSIERLYEEGWPVASVMTDLRDFASKHRAVAAKVVAFNAPFDYQFYSDCLFLGGSNVAGKFRHCPAPLLGPWQCAAMLARMQLGLPRYNLDTVAAHFGLARTTDKHGALEDAILAGRVYARLQALHGQAQRETAGRVGA